MKSAFSLAYLCFHLCRKVPELLPALLGETSYAIRLCFISHVIFMRLLVIFIEFGGAVIGSLFDKCIYTVPRYLDFAEFKNQVEYLRAIGRRVEIKDGRVLSLSFSPPLSFLRRSRSLCLSLSLSFSFFSSLSLSIIYLSIYLSISMYIYVYICMSDYLLRVHVGFCASPSEHTCVRMFDEIGCLHSQFRKTRIHTLLEYLASSVSLPPSSKSKTRNTHTVTSLAICLQLFWLNCSVYNVVDVFLGIAHAWTWLARILNHPPRSATASILLAFLSTAGYELLKTYRNQMHKMLAFLLQVGSLACVCPACVGLFLPFSLW